MKSRKLLATSLFGVTVTPLAYLFKLSVMAAMASRVMQGDTPMTLQPDGKAQIAFYPCEALFAAIFPSVRRVPHLILTVTSQSSITKTAEVCIEVDAPKWSHGYGPLSIDVMFPDQIFGLEHLISSDVKSTYRGLYFNSTPGEHQSNLFEVLNVLAAAFTTAFTDHLKREKERSCASPADETASSAI